MAGTNTGSKTRIISRKLLVLSYGGPLFAPVSCLCGTESNLKKVVGSPQAFRSWTVLFLNQRVNPLEDFPHATGTFILLDFLASIVENLSMHIIRSHELSFSVHISDSFFPKIHCPCLRSKKISWRDYLNGIAADYKE